MTACTEKRPRMFCYNQLGFCWCCLWMPILKAKFHGSLWFQRSQCLNANFDQIFSVRVVSAELLLLAMSTCSNVQCAPQHWIRLNRKKLLQWPKLFRISYHFQLMQIDATMGRLARKITHSNDYRKTARSKQAGRYKLCHRSQYVTLLDERVSHITPHSKQVSVNFCCGTFVNTMESRSCKTVSMMRRDS